MAVFALATGQTQAFEDHILSTFGMESWTDCQLVPFQFAGNRPWVFRGCFSAFIFRPLV